MGSRVIITGSRRTAVSLVLSSKKEGRSVNFSEIRKEIVDTKAILEVPK